MSSYYEQDWRNMKSNHIGLMAFKVSKKIFWDSPSATDINCGLPPGWSICVSPFHFVCELRKQIHQASPNFSWLLFPPNLWVMAHRQLMFCTWFSLHLWQFPVCLLVLNWLGLIWAFYWALVSSEGNGIRDIYVSLCMYRCIWLGRTSKQGLCRFVNYLPKETLSTCSYRARGILGYKRFWFSLPMLFGRNMTLSCHCEKIWDSLAAEMLNSSCSNDMNVQWHLTWSRW